LLTSSSDTSEKEFRKLFFDLSLIVSDLDSFSTGIAARDAISILLANEEEDEKDIFIIKSY
jgi:hypothetical protein